METKDLKISKMKNEELLEAQNMVSAFLKYLNSEYEGVKRLEAENA